jgi:hypothetical protein
MTYVEAVYSISMDKSGRRCWNFIDGKENEKEQIVGVTISLLKVWRGEGGYDKLSAIGLPSHLLLTIDESERKPSKKHSYYYENEKKDDFFWPLSHQSHKSFHFTYDGLVRKRPFE